MSCVPVTSRNAAKFSRLEIIVNYFQLPPSFQSHIEKGVKLNLGSLTTLPKKGDEKFHSKEKNPGYTLKDFWTWSASDLMSNVTRGHLAEFIVAKAIGAIEEVRNEWAAYDLTTRNGIKVEVKSAAYLQSWFQDDYSTIQFNVEKTKELDLKKGGYRGPAKRHADVYVFALLAHTDKLTVDPLNINQWEFYVLPTTALDERKRSQHSITLKSLEDLSGGKVDYVQLAKRVNSFKLRRCRT